TLISLIPMARERNWSPSEPALQAVESMVSISTLNRCVLERRSDSELASRGRPGAGGAPKAVCDCCCADMSQPPRARTQMKQKTVSSVRTLRRIPPDGRPDARGLPHFNIVILCPFHWIQPRSSGSRRRDRIRSGGDQGRRSDRVVDGPSAFDAPGD